MDAPKCETFEELMQIAADRKAWRSYWERTFPAAPANIPTLSMTTDVPQTTEEASNLHVRDTQRVPQNVTTPSTNNDDGFWFGHGADACWIANTTTATTNGNKSPQANRK